ncbi:hypothetical protein ACWZHB_01200 [Nocardia sp. FBN12]|uniref:hypothetical protein n=1 Tax=Nocardia sp. FBN12 TaxID=3419766 RepID=UPI003D07C777
MRNQVVEFDAINHTDPSISGGRLRCQTWYPGPLEDTVWVLDPDTVGLPNKGARVVDTRRRREIAWPPTAANETAAIVPPQLVTREPAAQFALF